MLDLCEMKLALGTISSPGQPDCVRASTEWELPTWGGASCRREWEGRAKRCDHGTNWLVMVGNGKVGMVGNGAGERWDPVVRRDAIGMLLYHDTKQLRMICERTIMGCDKLCSSYQVTHCTYCIVISDCSSCKIILILLFIIQLTFTSLSCFYLSYLRWFKLFYNLVRSPPYTINKCSS